MATDPRAEFDALDDALTVMDATLRDAADARLTLEQLGRMFDAVEAAAVLHVEGRNDSERRTRLTLELIDAARQMETVSAVGAARSRNWSLIVG